MIKGLNLNCSIRAMLFSVGLAVTSRSCNGSFLQRAFFQTMWVLVAVVYLDLAIQFCFRDPVIGISIVLLCIPAAIIQR